MYFESCKISAKVPLGGAEQGTISSWPSLDSASMRSHLNVEGLLTDGTKANGIMQMPVNKAAASGHSSKLRIEL